MVVGRKGCGHHLKGVFYFIAALASIIGLIMALISFYATEPAPSSEKDRVIPADGPQEAVSPDPEKPALQNSRSRRDLKIYDQAIAKLDPQDAVGNAIALTNRGTAYQALKMYNQAIDDYDQAIILWPRYPLAFYNRGTAYHQLGQHDHAIADYGMTISLNDQFADAFYNRGNIYRVSKNYSHAIQDFEAYIRIAEPRPEPQPAQQEMIRQTKQWLEELRLNLP